MSTVDILIKGRNRLLLFEKLKRANVSVLKTEEKEDSSLVIRIKYKDYNKVIEILKNVWYNKTVKYNGLIGVSRFLIKHLALFISMAAFIVSLFFIDDLLLFTEISGVSVYHERRIENVLKSVGVKPFAAFSAIGIGEIKNLILSDNERIGFVSVEKRGNTLKIVAVMGEEDRRPMEKPDSIVAKHSGVITSLSVLRGKALKAVGDRVVAGETVVQGVLSDGDAEYDSYAIATFTIACEYDYSTIVDDTMESTVAREIEALKAILGREDAVAKVSFSDSGAQTILNLTLTFSVTENGG